MTELTDFINPAAIQRILKCRSVMDKIGIPVQYRSMGDEIAITELLNRGMMKWIYHSMMMHPARLCDVYQLTQRGIELCDQEGIRRH